MANDCSNNVQLEGTEAQLRNLSKAIAKSIEKMIPGEGFRFILSPPSYSIAKVFGDIVLEDNYSLHFITKWSADPVQMIQLCKPFGVNFVYSYEEGSYYGEFQYIAETDLLRERSLSEEQYQSCVFCGEYDDAYGDPVCPKGCDGGDECNSKENNFEQMNRTLELCEWNDMHFDLETCEYQDV